jgi:hypothetical protein
VRLDGTARRRTAVVAVVEAQPFVVAAGGDERGEDVRIRGGTRPVRRHGDQVHLQRAHAAPQARGQDVLELRQRPQRRLLHPGDAAAHGRPQADRHGHGLLVVQQQRRDVGARAQAVAADRAPRRLHRIAEAAQPLDVVADRAPAHAEPLGELGTGPVARGLQEREQPQEACRRLQHGAKSACELGTRRA